MSGEGFLVWHMVWFWSLVCVGLASASITVESLTCEGKNGKCAKPRCMAKVGSMSSGTCTCEVRADKVCGTKIHDQGECKG